MKRMLVINSLCMDRHIKFFKEDYPNFRWDYPGLIKDAQCNEVLYFYVSEPSEAKAKFLQVLDIEYGVKLIAAPVNELINKCQHCNENNKQYEYSLYNTTLASATIAKCFQFNIDEVFFMGLDRPDTSIIRELRRQGISVLGETFSKLNNIPMKANCNLGLRNIDEHIDDYVSK